MPRIQDLLDGDLIIEDLQATDKTGVIREFASFLKRPGQGAGRGTTCQRHPSAGNHHHRDR